MFVADLSLLFWCCWTKADSRPANERNITLSLSSVIPEPQPGVMKEWKHDRDRDTQNLGFSDSLSRIAKLGLHYPERSARLSYTVKQRGLTWATLSHSHGNDLTCPSQSIIITQDFTESGFPLLPRDFWLGFQISQVNTLGDERKGQCQRLKAARFPVLLSVVVFSV